MAPSFFDSPNLSPIAVARPRPDGATAAATPTAAAGDDFASRAGGGASNWRGEPRGGSLAVSALDGGGGGGDGGGGGSGAPLNTDARRRQRCSGGFGHGLSPILSEGGYSASSRGGREERRAFDDQPARDESVRTSRASDLKMGADGDDDDGDDRRHAEWRAEAPGRGASPFCPGGAAGLRSARAAARSSGSGPLFMDSSADVTRSSVLRASTTLNTIAPLDDDAGLLLSSCSSRTGGVSFAGELFADARLRVSSGAERAPRYDVFAPLREEKLRRGGGGGAGVPPFFLRRQELPQRPQQQQQQQYQRRRRSRSAPTLASEWSVHSSRSEVERLAAEMARETASAGHGGVPPAVVGAWLAAAVEGIYSHNAGGGGRGVEGAGGGRGVTDQRIGARRGQMVGGRGFLVSDPAAAAARASRAHRVGGTPAFAAGPGDSPPPPPPPPAEGPMMNGGEEDEETVNEQEIFYQRQRLLQRVVSAAASHGGGVPSLLSSVVRDRSLEEGAGRGDQGEQDAGSSSCSAFGAEHSWRRHSGPPASWETPPVTVTAAAMAVAGCTEVAGCTVGGVPAAAAYTQRHTSRYWRDRLGMTH